MKKSNSSLAFCPRYGNYSFKTYKAWWYCLVLFLSVSVIRKQIDIGTLLFATIVMVFQRIITHGEFYAIQNDSIITKRLFCKKAVSLPNELILIVAKGSTLSFPYRRLRDMDHLIELNDCYMVCIVDNCTLREALNIMHWNRFSKEYRYSNIVVKEIFDDNTYSDFLYSFVYDAEQVQKLAVNHDCQIILPKSLEGKVDLSGLNIPIHVDEEG